MATALEALIEKPTAEMSYIEYAIKLCWAMERGEVAEAAIEELTALRDRVAKLEDALLISGNLLADVKNFFEIEIKVCNGVGMEYELGLVESIDAFQDLHGETVKELGEKHERGDE